MKELHLFILWSKANNKKEILECISRDFKVRNIFNFNWDKQYWDDNLSRFYAIDMENTKAKEKECGTGKFKVIVIEDDKSKYERILTSKGYREVNVNMFNKKTECRELAGGGFKVHSSTTVEEANHDFTLLFHKNVDDFEKKYKPSDKVIDMEMNLIACDGFKSLDELFYTMNNCSNYVVLRDFENDLTELTTIKEYDADILCDDLNNMKCILNASKENDIYTTIVNKQRVLFDIKYLGDGYYCESLENDILKTRIFHNKYFVPNKDLLYKSHLLHALIHKNNYETEYNERLSKLYKEHNANNDKKHYTDMLSKWMIKNGYFITVEKENPTKLNIDNVKLFNQEVYNKNLVEEIGLKKRIKELEEQNIDLKREIEIIENTKGYKLLNTIRKIVIGIKNIAR